MDEYRVVIFLVSSVAPLSMGRPEIFDFWYSANELVTRVTTLFAGNHIDLPNRGKCHVSPFHLFVSFQMSGPIAYK